MKKITIYLAAALTAALTLAGCQKETPHARETTLDLASMTFEVAAAVVENDADTRALKAAWEDGDRIVALFDGAAANHVTLTYDASGETWTRSAAVGTISATGGTTQALHAGSGALAYDGETMTGIGGDLLFSDAGTYKVEEGTARLTLTMSRGVTTVVKMEGAGDNASARLAGEGIRVLKAVPTLAADALAGGFAAALPALFEPSDMEAGKAAHADPRYTTDAVAVFHVYAPAPAADTRFTVGRQGEDEVYTRDYADKSLAAGVAVAIAGPWSTDTEQAGEWTSATLTPPVAEGTTGPLAWRLSADGTLTISGEGAMPDYTDTADIPWYEYREDIETVVIADGVKSIGRAAFYECTALTEITIPESVMIIRDIAFEGCSALTEITIPASVESIGDGAFYGCDALTDVTGLATMQPTLGANNFTADNDILHVLAGSVETYRNGAWGGEFSSVVAIDSGPGNDPSGMIRMTLNLDGLTTRAGGGSIAFGVAGTGNVTIDWGDGQKTVAPINTEAEQRFPHTYAESAVYEVTVAGDIWSLDCSRSGLIGLDISAAPGLVTLRCSGNSLTDFVHDERSLPALDLSGDKAITELVINTANTTTLDVSGCTALVNLTAKPGSGASGALESVNVAGCTALEFIDFGNNRLTQVDVSTNAALKTLYVYSNRLTALDVSRNTALESLLCDFNGNLTTLDVRQNSALVYLLCDHTGITELDLSGNPGLYQLSCRDNELGSLDLSANPNLGYLDCEYTGLSELDLSHNTMMHSLDCSMNKLTEIVFPEMEEHYGSHWEFFDCSDNLLTSLQIDRNVGFRFLDCSRNPIRYITQLTDEEIAEIRAEVGGYTYGEQEAERELVRRIALAPLRFPELTVMNCSMNNLVGLSLEATQSLETLVCSQQGYNPEWGGRSCA